MTKIPAITMILLATACTQSPQEPIEAAPQHRVPAGGKGDGPGSKDARIISCHLEYETFSPEFASAPIDAITTTFGTVVNEGLVLANADDAVVVYSNPSPTTNLSFIVQLTHAGKAVSYAVLPDPEVGGDYLFELGGAIPPTKQGYDPTEYDFVRAWCSLSDPS